MSQWGPWGIRTLGELVKSAQIYIFCVMGPKCHISWKWSPPLAPWQWTKCNTAQILADKAIGDQHSVHPRSLVPFKQALITCPLGLAVLILEWGGCSWSESLSLWILLLSGKVLDSWLVCRHLGLSVKKLEKMEFGGERAWRGDAQWRTLGELCVDLLRSPTDESFTGLFEFFKQVLTSRSHS